MYRQQMEAAPAPHPNLSNEGVAMAEENDEV